MVNNKVVINQIDKIGRLAARCNIKKTNHQEVLIKVDKLLRDFEDEPIIDDITWYQSILGELLFIARLTRLDIQFPVNQL